MWNWPLIHTHTILDPQMPVILISAHPVSCFELHKTLDLCTGQFVARRLYSVVFVCGAVRVCVCARARALLPAECWSVVIQLCERLLQWSRSLSRSWEQLYPARALSPAHTGTSSACWTHTPPFSTTLRLKCFIQLQIFSRQTSPYWFNFVKFSKEIHNIQMSNSVFGYSNT